MRTPEIPHVLLDANGREITPLAFGRLSEQGRKEAIMPWMGPEAKEFPNFRFQIFEVRPEAEASPIIAKSLEYPKVDFFVLRPEWIVIESK